MKKIINGKCYNTETATKLGYWSNGLSYRDFSWCEEALYRTKKGAYFIAGEGGPMTGYAESCGQNSRGSGSDLFVVTESEAREWMETHEDADAYEAAFGAVEEA